MTGEGHNDVDVKQFVDGELKKLLGKNISEIESGEPFFRESKYYNEIERVLITRATYDDLDKLKRALAVVISDAKQKKESSSLKSGVFFLGCFVVCFIVFAALSVPMLIWNSGPANVIVEILEELLLFAGLRLNPLIIRGAVVTGLGCLLLGIPLWFANIASETIMTDDIERLIETSGKIMNALDRGLVKKEIELDIEKQ